MASPRDAFSQLEYAGWQRVAARYDSAWSGLTRLFIPALLEAIQPRPGPRILDVACGPGYVAEALRAAGASPLGVDFSPEMVRLACARNPAIPYACGDAQALPFAAGSLDAVAMNFGLLHLRHPHAAFAEARRVLRPEGRFAFTVWAGPALSEGAAIVDRAIRAHADFDVGLPEAPDYFGYGDATQCGDALGRFGFDPASLRFLTVTAIWQVPTAAFVFAAEREAGVRTAALLAAQSPAVLAAIGTQMAQGLAVYRNAAGLGIPYAAHVVGVTAP